MGQTLTHGVYLPDEGERNCYNGLAANWSILDGAVGTIAEHSTQISGKAPLVHTHTKADITDLFNSANTWTASQTFTDTNRQFPNAEKGVRPSSNNNRYEYINDKNGVNLGSTQFSYTTAGELSYSLRLENLYDSNNQLSPNGSTKYVFTSLGVTSDGTPYYKIYGNTIPNNTNRFDLGTSANQWKSVYAQSYYYNGVAWGLDKENVWSGSNRFTKSINLTNVTSYTDCSLGFFGLYNVLFFNTRGSSNITSYGTYVYYGYSNVSPDRGAIIRMVRTTDRRGETNDGYIPDTSFNLYKISPEKLFIDFMEAVRVTNDGTENSLKPITNNATDLGTSTNKWKTLNGVNPGALSLPDTLGTSGTENVNYFNVIGYLNNTGTLATIPSTATYDGWLYINAKDGADSYIIIDDSPSNFGTSVFGNNGLGVQGIGLLCLMCPIRKGHAYNVRIKSAGIVSARIYPAQGNV